MGEGSGRVKFKAIILTNHLFTIPKFYFMLTLQKLWAVQWVWPITALCVYIVF